MRGRPRAAPQWSCRRLVLGAHPPRRFLRGAGIVPPGGIRGVVIARPAGTHPPDRLLLRLFVVLHVLFERVLGRVVHVPSSLRFSRGTRRRTTPKRRPVWGP